MKRKLIIGMSFLIGTGIMTAQNYFDDDIYYNPKKDTSVKQTVKKESTYIKNMADMDVDIYNRRGETYYVSAVDTIGSYVENGEDFVYTQQIQKFYNPTIVVENANVLEDVLENAYGNVEIVLNSNGVPVFLPVYGWNYPYYSSVWSPWSWGFNFGGWGWNIGFYNPWYSWNWGPSWAWGPSWNWGPGWGPGWGWNHGWGPGWGPGWRPGPGRPINPGPMANWRPAGNRPVGPNPGFANGPRPAGNANMANRLPAANQSQAIGRPSNSGAQNNSPALTPNRVNSGTRPIGGLKNNMGVVNNNGKWEYKTTPSTGPSTPSTSNPNLSPNRNQGGRVQSGIVSTPSRNNTQNASKAPQNTVNSSTNNYNTNSNRTNRGSFNTSSGSMSSGSRGGFSTGGAGRSTGGGGASRGGRR